MISRRSFLLACLAAAAARVRPRPAAATDRLALGFPDAAREWRGASSVASLSPEPASDWVAPRADATGAFHDWTGAGARLRARFPDLRRHFVFEYYPWYGVGPYRHWNEAKRNPPLDIAATSMPLLGPYDSRSRAVIEQHARWIAEAGVGAINISWWGPGSFCDRVTPLVMDVMRDHDIHVTFHLEPYRDDRADLYVHDILYLLREYGARRRWDCFLLLRDADGSQGPVFKSFRTILAATVVDCHGITHRVRDHTADDRWRRQTDRLREELRRDFDRVTLLADSLHMSRTAAAGFDGIAVYDNFVRPERWPGLAAAARPSDLLFSFNVNPGFDAIELREVPPDSCYVPPPFEPPASLNWADASDRERAVLLSSGRITESFATTLHLQTDSSLTNAQRGFFLTYINSFNEWHEGTQFEPMRNYADLRPDERALGYHNPAAGDYRLRHLERLLWSVIEDAPALDLPDLPSPIALPPPEAALPA